MPPRLRTTQFTSSTLTQNLSSPSSTNALRPAQSRTFTSSRSQQADLIRRPRRPYQFTQLLTLSDGSTVLHRTTSPAPVYRSNKDVRNTPLWNPANAKLANLEEDEAGRLSSFRRRFGRGFDTGNEPATAGAARIDPQIKPGSMQEASVEAAKKAEVETGKKAGKPSAALQADGQSSGVWDARKDVSKEMPTAPDVAGKEKEKGTSKTSAPDAASAPPAEEEEDNLMDLISSFSGEEEPAETAKKQPAARKPAGKGGKKK